MDINDRLFVAIRTYINYFGENAIITRKGLILYLSDVENISSKEIYSEVDRQKRLLVQSGYLKTVKSGQYLISKEIPFDTTINDLSNNKSITT